MNSIPSVKALYKKISKNSLKPNTVLKGGEIWHARYVGRRLSIYFTWLFLHTNISPNAITIISMSLGIAACILISIPETSALIASFVFFELSLILDSTDGEVARYKKQYSLLGNYLDTITHVLIYITLYISIGINIYFRSGNIVFIILGILTALAFTLGSIIHHLDPLLLKKGYLESRENDNVIVYYGTAIYNFVIEDLNIIFTLIILGIFQYQGLIEFDIFKIILVINFFLIIVGGIIFNLTRKIVDPRYNK